MTPTTAYRWLRLTANAVPALRDASRNAVSEGSDAGATRDWPSRKAAIREGVNLSYDGSNIR